MPMIVNTFSSSSLIFRSFSFFLKLCVIPRQKLKTPAPRIASPTAATIHRPSGQSMTRAVARSSSREPPSSSAPASAARTTHSRNRYQPERAK